MTKSDETVALFRSGFNCAQAVLRTYGADLGLTLHDALNARPNPYVSLSLAKLRG